MKATQNQCLGCSNRLPEGRRGYCSNRCRERLKKQRQRLRKRGQLVPDEQALQYIIPKTKYRKAQLNADQITEEWSTYLNEEARLLAVVDDYQQQNDELHATALALHRELKAAQTHAMHLALIVARLSKQSRTNPLDATQRSLVNHYLARAHATAPPQNRTTR